MPSYVIPTSAGWKLRKLDGRDEGGVQFSARNGFLQVVADCMVGLRNPKEAEQRSGAIPNGIPG